MRIVAGEFSSRRLAALKGDHTRPTLDKVREAVFSSLGGMFSGGVFLDLYAGSGAVGLEALSRGMDQCIFVEKARDAMEIVRRNAESLGVTDRCLFLQMSDLKALDLLKEKNMQFDIAYLDPPYRKERNVEVMQKMSEGLLLKNQAAVAVESLKEDHFPQEINTLHRIKEAEYGITRITYYRCFLI